MTPIWPGWDELRTEIEAGRFPANFGAMVASAAERFGETTALNFFDDGTSLTYGELADQVNALADGLHRLGVRKGTRVAVYLPNRIEFPVTWLALGVLGAVMVPTNTAYVGAELDYVYNDAGVEFAVVDPRFLETLEAMERPCVPADKVVVTSPAPPGRRSWDDVMASGSSDFAPTEQVAQSDLINIQYTSGTTGFPKGCMQTQRYWFIVARVAGSASRDVASLLTDHPYFYMDPLWQLVWAVDAGLTVHAASHMSASKFWDRVRTNDIQWAWFPPPILKLDPSPDDRRHPIKRFHAGAVSASAIQQAEERYGVTVRPAYGMTEIGAGTVIPEQLPVGVDPELLLATVGVPAPFRELRIVDPDGQVVPLGHPGELQVRGDGIFEGYWNKPEVNAEAFVDGWFRTGDVFVETSEGCYKIVGRVKDMIRRSSENISAMEVEYAVREIPQVADAAAVAVPDEYRGEEVKIYVQLKAGEECSPADILARCSQRLAPFKVPRFVAFVDDFPRTGSNKIAKAQLTDGVVDLRADAFDRDA